MDISKSVTSDKICVSIIVMAYNQEDTIRRTIDSIIGQKRAFNIEILLGDDHSYDGTPDIFKEYERKYPKEVRALIQPVNLGIPYHYYELVKHCQGKYIMICGGDDYWLPEKLEKQYKYMENNPDISLCCGKAVKCFNNIIKHDNYLGDKRVEDYNYLILHNCISPVTACWKSVDLFECIKDMKVEDKSWIMEDYPVWLWFAKYRKIHYMDEELCVYNISSNSLSHPQNIMKRIKFIDCTRDIQMYFAENEVSMLKKIDSEYEENIATAFFLVGDVKKYRIHNLKSRKMKNMLKNVLSYLPNGIDILKKQLNAHNVI